MEFKIDPHVIRQVVGPPKAEAAVKTEFVVAAADLPTRSQTTQPAVYADLQMGCSLAKASGWEILVFMQGAPWTARTSPRR